MSDVARQMRLSSVTRAIRVLGDRWSILIIRDAFVGVRRFQDFLERTGTSRATLTNRLQSLVKAGLFRRAKYSDSPARYEYRLTDKGRDLYQLSLAAWAWERKWAPKGAGIPRQLLHRPCEHETVPTLKCGHCSQAILMKECRVVPGPGANARAPAAPARYRRLSALTSETHRGSAAGLTHIADIVGDPWSPLVLAATYFGLKRFDEFQRELGIATNILASRLELLVGQKILKRHRYSKQPERFEYLLTPKGHGLFTYALLLNDWGERWLLPPAGPPYYIVHTVCGQNVKPEVRCSHCDVALVPGSVAAKGARTA